MAYVANDLFPLLKEKHSRREQRAYVLERLVDMAESGTLFLTDCVNQPGTRAYRQAVADYVGQCILGHGHDANGNPREGLTVPRPLADFRVRIVAIPHHVQVDKEVGAGRVDVSYVDKVTEITFCAGKVPFDEHPNKSEAMSAGLNAASSATEVFVADIVETGEIDTTLYVKDAWRCLRKQGEHFALAPSRRIQGSVWKCKEVRPGEDPTATPTKKVGRPARGKAKRESSGADEFANAD